MPSALTSPVLAALQTLQDAILGTSEGQQASSAAQGISQNFSHLSAAVQALLQRQSALEHDSENRNIAEKVLRNVIANKDAEGIRLRSEIARLQHSLRLEQQSAVAGSAGESSTAAAPLDPAERQAVLAAAVAAKDKPTALIAQLESEVSACQVRIFALEAELATAEAGNATRLADQQKAFLAKLEQLRKVHAEQMAAAAEQARQAELQQSQARCQQLEKQLAGSKEQQQQQQGLIQQLQQQVDNLQQQVGQLEQQQQTQRLQPLQPQQQQRQPIVFDSQALNDKALADVSALQIMEGQLVRLSGIIRSHEAEIDQLRHVLTAGCAERQQLVQQLQQLTLQQQQQVAQPVNTAAALTAIAADAAKGKRGKLTNGAGSIHRPGARRAAAT